MKKIMFICDASFLLRLPQAWRDIGIWFSVHSSVRQHL